PAAAGASADGAGVAVAAPPLAATAAVPPRGRVVAGTALFVLGFSVVFMAYGAALGGLGHLLTGHARVLTQVLGGLTILLGLPFLLVSFGFQVAMRAFAFFRRHARLVTRVGGAMLICVGLLEVTGAWSTFMAWLQVHWVSTYEPPI